MPTSREHTGRGRKLTGAKRRKPRAPRRRQLMKRTSKKGAYQKSKVMAMAIRRNPLTENKTRELAAINFGDTSGQIANPIPYNPLMASTLLPPGTFSPIWSTGQYNLLTLANFYTQFQVGQRTGVDNSDRIIGNNVFAKYLNVKGIVRFPGGTDIPIVPQNLELIWGWCPAINATTTTAPAITALSPADIYAHITRQVSEYVNAQSDQLRFHPKRDQSCQIIGRRKIRPNLNRQYSVPPNNLSHTLGATTVAGNVPDVKFNVSFKMFKKIHFDRGGTIQYQDDAGNQHDEVCYNLNDHRIPFVLFYQPDYSTAGGGYPNGDNVPNVAYNSMFYFTDS